MPKIQFTRAPLPHEIATGVLPYRVGQIVEVPVASADRWKRRGAAIDAPEGALTDEEAAAKAEADAREAEATAAAEKAAAEAKAKEDEEAAAKAEEEQPSGRTRRAK